MHSSYCSAPAPPTPGGTDEHELLELWGKGMVVPFLRPFQSPSSEDLSRLQEKESQDSEEAMTLTRLALALLMLALTVLSAVWGYGWPEGVLNWLEDWT